MFELYKQRITLLNISLLQKCLPIIYIVSSDFFFNTQATVLESLLLPSLKEHFPLDTNLHDIGKSIAQLRHYI